MTRSARLTFSATAGRLLQNQVDVGNAIKPFYGEQAGDRLTALLHDHITIAVELLQAAKSGDSTAFEDAADELGGDYAGSVATYEAIHTHILAMADTLSSGIIAQFPRRFR